MANYITVSNSNGVNSNQYNDVPEIDTSEFQTPTE